MTGLTDLPMFGRIERTTASVRSRPTYPLPICGPQLANLPDPVSAPSTSFWFNSTGTVRKNNYNTRAASRCTMDLHSSLPHASRFNVRIRLQALRQGIRGISECNNFDRTLYLLRPLSVDLSLGVHTIEIETPLMGVRSPPIRNTKTIICKLL